MEAFLKDPQAYRISKEINYDGVKRVSINKEEGWIEWVLVPQKITLYCLFKPHRPLWPSLTSGLSHPSLGSVNRRLCKGAFCSFGPHNKHVRKYQALLEV